MTGHSRYASSHAGSSAFSASANANEDWTKISDLAERRRIQNRIAQRNYRKKLKRRLEDLERRAGSSSASPEQQHSELTTSSNNSKPRQTSTQASRSIESQEVQQLSPELLALDDRTLFDSSRSLSSPSRTGFIYSTYPPTLTHLQHEYQQTSYQSDQQDYFYAYQHPIDYSQSLPPTLPTMLPSTYAGKQESLLGDEDIMNPFSMNYASLAGFEVPTNQSYDGPGSHSHVNPTNFLSRSHSPAYI
ncbi:hypothetical protein DV736_g4904, partial [Chaetothyriales sp. CBS 134916]